MPVAKKASASIKLIKIRPLISNGDQNLSVDLAGICEIIHILALKKMRNNFFLVSILMVLVSFTQVKAQMPILEATTGDYAHSLRTVSIVRNNDDLLPLKYLEKTKIAFWPMADGAPMGETLAKYTTIQYVDAESISKADFNVLIVLAEKVNNNDFQELKPFFARKDIKTILFIPEKELPNAPNDFDAVVTAMFMTPLTQSIAAQEIFGGIISHRNADVYKKDRGHHTPFRLGYAPPEVVGMNRQILEDSIRAIVNYGIEQGAFPGAQVLVAKNGKIIYHEAFGSPTYAKLRPLSTDDIYDMASITKVTTALPALMILNGEGKFNLDEPLKKLWPKFKRSNKANLTWRSVLAHNARLQPWIAYWKNTLRKKPKRNGWRYKARTFKPKPSKRYSVKITDSLWLRKNYRKKIFRAIKKTPLNKEPGYKYSGLAFYIFPTIVEKQTGDEFEHFLKSKIYQPLGANTLTFNPLRFYPKDRIIPTELDTFFRMQQIQGTVHDEGAIMMGGVNGNAGLFGTANDMAKLWQMYLNKGAYGGQQFIKPEVIDEFTKCQYCEEGNHRGLGFDKPLVEYNPDKASYAKEASPGTFGHAGYTGTLIWADPENQLLVIFLSNRVYQTRKNRLLYTLNLRPRLHHAIYSAIE